MHPTRSKTFKTLSTPVSHRTMTRVTGLGLADAPMAPLVRAGAQDASPAAMLLRNDDGVTLAFVANTLPADVVGFFDALRAALAGAAAGIQAWPDIDLFETGT